MKIHRAIEDAPSFVYGVAESTDGSSESEGRGKRSDFAGHQANIRQEAVTLSV